MVKSSSFSDRLFNYCNYTFMILLGIITLYPFLNVLAISLNESMNTIRGGITIFPRVFTLDNYKQIFNYEQIPGAIMMSILRTVVGTATGILSTAMIAYVVSRNDFFARKFVTALFVITMYVSGGMIPVYMLIRNLGLMNNFFVYILPGLVSAFNVIVLRSYIDGLPIDLQESAKIDGANDFIIFLRIILPLCLPVIATLSLFIAVSQWNNWFDTYLYASSNEKLTTLQFELQKILSNAQASYSQAMRDPNAMNQQINRVSPESIRMAMTVIATVPILLVYPFVQKYFVTGLTLGAVKS